MKKAVILVALMACMVSFSAISNAGQAVGTVTNAGIYINNLVAITVNGSSGMPSCSGGGGRFGFSMQDVAAKGMYATTLTAKGSNANLYVVGTGECTAWPNREDVKYIEIK